MKLLKITIAFLALVSLQIAAAQWLHVPPPVEARNLMVVGGGVPVVAGCSESTNEINSARNSEGDTGRTISPDQAILFSSTADCSGGLKTAYVWYQNNGNGDQVKVCVYNYDGVSEPENDVSENLIACSAALTSAGSVGWLSASFSSGNVVSGGNYWVMVVAKSDTDFSYLTLGTTTSYYKTATGFFASPPDPIGSGWNTIGFGVPSVYVTIGASW